MRHLFPLCFHRSPAFPALLIASLFTMAACEPADDGPLTETGEPFSVTPSSGSPANDGTSADEWVGIKTGLWFNADPNELQLSHNISFDNANFNACTGGYPNTEPCTPIDFEGVDGNLVVDPLFVSPDDFHLQSSSPAINGGQTDVLDLDGSISDIGVYGGPYAPENLP